MILSKGNLQVIEIIKKDKSTPILNNILITKDGKTIAANRNILMAVSSLSDEYKKSLPIDESKIYDDILISAETAGKKMEI